MAKTLQHLTAVVLISVDGVENQKPEANVARSDKLRSVRGTLNASHDPIGAAIVSKPIAKTSIIAANVSYSSLKARVMLSMTGFARYWANVRFSV